MTENELIEKARAFRSKHGGSTRYHPKMDNSQMDLIMADFAAEALAAERSRELAEIVIKQRRGENPQNDVYREAFGDGWCDALDSVKEIINK